jgi:hypothetical protein
MTIEEKSELLIIKEAVERLLKINQPKVVIIKNKENKLLV